jgi:hypothetical protein
MDARKKWRFVKKSAARRNEAGYTS